MLLLSLVVVVVVVVVVVSILLFSPGQRDVNAHLCLQQPMKSEAPAPTRTPDGQFRDM